MNYTSIAIEEVSNEITVIDAAELISGKCSDCEFALDVNIFHYHQDKDKEILKQVQNKIRKNSHSIIYTTKEVEGVDLVHKNNEIRLSKILKERVMYWYHSILVHPGWDCMEDSIRSLYTWKDFQPDVTQYCKSCDICQRCKRTQKKKYGFLPKKGRNHQVEQSKRRPMGSKNGKN